jgi:choline kinase
VIGVILAAGRGYRLQPISGDMPKCLVSVGGRSLLGRQLDLLRAAGVERVAVVGGYGFAAVTRAVTRDVVVVRNTRYASTNSLYSLWTARHLLSRGFVVLNCDVVCHPQLLTDLLTCRHDDALLYAPQGPDEIYSDEEMKVHVRKGRVVDLSKMLEPDLVDGENVGIARFSARGAASLIEQLSDHIERGAVREWLPAAFAAFARKWPLFAIPTRGYPWIEIDSPDDYWRACDDVVPAIEGVSLEQAPAVVTLERRPLHHV